LTNLFIISLIFCVAILCLAYFVKMDRKAILPGKNSTISFAVSAAIIGLKDSSKI